MVPWNSFLDQHSSKSQIYNLNAEIWKFKFWTLSQLILGSKYQSFPSAGYSQAGVYTFKRRKWILERLPGQGSCEGLQATPAQSWTRLLGILPCHFENVQGWELHGLPGQLQLRRFFLTSSWNFPCYTFSFYCSPLRRVWLHLLYHSALSRAVRSLQIVQLRGRNVDAMHRLDEGAPRYPCPWWGCIDGPLCSYQYFTFQKCSS